MRKYQEEKVKAPSKSELETFLASNQEYVTTTVKPNEELIMKRLKSGNEYLQEKGFSIGKTVKITFEKS